MKKILAILALAAATITPAHAWGDREQGMLAGIAATLIYQHIAQGHAGAVPPVMPPVAYPQPQAYPYPQHYPQPQIVVPQRPPVIVVPQQPQVIVVPSAHGHRHGHYNGGHGYYQLPDPRVYNPQMR